MVRGSEFQTTFAQSVSAFMCIQIVTVYFKKFDSTYHTVEHFFTFGLVYSSTNGISTCSITLFTFSRNFCNTIWSLATSAVLVAVMAFGIVECSIAFLTVKV